MHTHDPAIADILRFWFEEAGMEMWFQGGEAFDARCRDRLMEPYERAAARDLDGWTATAEGALALCLLLDQAPRNMFRGTPRMFATDDLAVTVARAAVDPDRLEGGLDAALTEDQRAFLYLPFEHAEDIECQRLAVRLFAGRTRNPVYLDFACKHHVIIDRFGRFPHRNAVLGRETTAEEAAFLTLPGSGF